MKEKMKDPFSKRIWLSFGIIVGSIAAAAIALYLLSSSLAAAAHRIVVDRTLAVHQTDALENLAQLKHDAPIAAQYTAAINQLLPDQDQLFNFSDWVNGIAARHGVTVMFSFQGNPAPAQPNTAGSAPFSLSVNGPQADAIAFVQDIETQAPGYLLTINSFDVAGDGTNVQMSGQGALFFK